MKYLILKRISLLALMITFLLGACKKTSDLVILRDTEGVDGAIWDDEASVQYLLNDAYQFIIPEFIYQYTANSYAMHIVSDENYWSADDGLGKKLFQFNGFLTANEPRYVANKYAGANIGENRYFDVAKCNMAIKNLPGSPINEAVKKKLLGQFYALRGMLYFGLAKIYGGMPLVLEPQNPDNLTLGGRVKARGMFEQVVKDYDSALANLDKVVWVDPVDRGRISKVAVACLKAKALLWWASPLFNKEGHANYDPARWQTALTAVETAYNMAVADGKALMPVYGNIFQVEGAANREAILVRPYSAIHVKKHHGVESRGRPSSEGGTNNNSQYYPSMNMLEAYTMKDGIPRNESPTYTYDPMLFWKDRDPRFDATIAYNGSTWPLSNKPNRRQWTYELARADGFEEGTRGVIVRRFSTPGLARTAVGIVGDMGGSGMDWIEIRLAEVMLDYAECANETGNLPLAKELVKKIRQRAGIVVGTQDYGLGLASDKTKMRDLLMNERMVEFAFEGKRNDDLRRTRRMHLLKGSETAGGLLGALRVPLLSAGLRDSLETPIGPNTLGLDPGLLRRDTLNINNKASLLKYFRYPYTIQIPANNGGFAMPEEYYFFSLSNQFLNSSPLLEQTIGWDGGTFDPL